MKGTVLELVIVFVILGATMMMLLLSLKIYNEGFADKWPTTTVGNTTKAAALASLDVLNYGMVFLLVGMVISLMLSAFFIQTHPIFFIISLVMLIIVVVVAAPISNAFMNIATSDGLATEATSYDISTQIVGNFPLIAVVAGLLIIIALYAKPGGGGV